MSLWCVNVIFNPAGYKSRLDNYFIFKERLSNQKINLLTVELTFNDQKPNIPDALHLHSNSILWQKERLINYAITQLPPDCDKVAWLDSDLLLPDGWHELTINKLNEVDFVQLFQNVHFFNEERKVVDTKKGIVWQAKNYGEHWIPLRLGKQIGHAEPGFGWAAKRQYLNLYDKLIIGSGDNWLADCLLGSNVLHHYLGKLTEEMLLDMNEWKENFKTHSVDYLPIDIHHLWHGSTKDRGYLTRDLIFKLHNFNPKTDIKLCNNVWEWSTEKPLLHQAIINYFKSRQEDGNK